MESVPLRMWLNQEMDVDRATRYRVVVQTPLPLRNSGCTGVNQKRRQLETRLLHSGEELLNGFRDLVRDRVRLGSPSES